MDGQRPSSGRWLRVVVFPVATAALSMGVVWRASAATTDRAAGGGQGGRVTAVLTDDAGGLPLFDAGPIVPGDSGERCISVTSAHAAPGELRMYFTGAADRRSALDQHLFITVEQGTGGSAASCASFVPDGAPIVGSQSLATAAATYHDFLSGAGPWWTTGDAPETVGYRISWSFDTTGMSPVEENALMGATSTIGYQWELHDR